jgi:hypothetical protein
MSVEKPETITDLCSYIDKYKDSIYVREFVDGKWQSLSLIKLPTDKAIEHVLRFISNGFIPTIIKKEGET